MIHLSPMQAYLHKQPLQHCMSCLESRNTLHFGTDKTTHRFHLECRKRLTGRKLQDLNVMLEIAIDRCWSSCQIQQALVLFVTKLCSQRIKGTKSKVAVTPRHQKISGRVCTFIIIMDLLIIWDMKRGTRETKHCMSHFWVFKLLTNHATSFLVKLKAFACTTWRKLMAS